MPKPQPRIAGLPGSLRKQSCTRAAVRIALDGAAHAGAATELVDLSDFDLPLCAGMDSDFDYPESVMKLREVLKRADGIILGTPEYHGSYSGVLKNALDLMAFPQFELKMVGLVSVSGGAMGGLEAMTGLRAVCRSLHAWVVPNQAAVPSAHKHFGPTKNQTARSGTVNAPWAIRSRVSRCCTQKRWVNCCASNCAAPRTPAQAE